MKKNSRFLLFAVSVLSAAVLLSCNEDPKNIPIKGVTLNEHNLSLVIGSQYSLTANLDPANATDKAIIWASDNETVATVSSNGLVKALAYGRATITVQTPKGASMDNCKITVVQKSKYTNPVILRSVPDPTIIQVTEKEFYLYSTEDIRNIPIFHSLDLVNWRYVGTAFKNETRPTFEPNGGLWAPDINYINGKYVLYYSMSVWGGGMTCGIGVAVSDSPEGPFTDRGALFRSNTIGVQNSIDQNYVEDNGRKYLFWGSFHGIYGIELSDDGLSLKPGAEKRQIAGTAYEGSYIHKRGTYYYLFASIGSCCNGLNSTYTTVVGRSENLWGDYTDKSGRSMMQNYHETVIRKNDFFVGVGHNSEIVQDKAGNDWILYHGYSVTAPNERRLFLDKIVWLDDWPTVVDDSPSIEAAAPIFIIDPTP